MIAVKAAGNAAVLVDVSDAAVTPAAFGAGVTAARLPGVLDVVPGACTVLVSAEPGSWATSELAGVLLALPPPPPESGSPPGVTQVDVCYDGPDLADVAALTGLSVPEVIARHQAGRYRVGWLGFSPGFGYLTGLDPALASVPRLASPRVVVPMGSVAIAGGLAAVYPASSPGGWRLLGRTRAVLWAADRDPPALLTPGARVRFRAIERLPDAPAADRLTSPGMAAGSGAIEVLQPGPLTTVQDIGRPGLAHLGVPHSGAADAGSLRLANELAGNKPGDAALEVTLGRLTLRFSADAIVALAGAPVPVEVMTPAAGGPLPTPAPAVPAFAVPAGAIVRLGAPTTGLRSYLAMHGGLDVPAVLRSRSTDTMSGLGPRPLRAGDRLSTLPARSPITARQATRPRRIALPAPGGEVTLRAIPGPRDDWFTAAAMRALADGAYTVAAASNRAGLRLTGPILERVRHGELPSEGMALGSLQVPADGQPILLLADHPTTGGYPVIAVVHSADIGLAAQLRPGQRLRFVLED